MKPENYLRVGLVNAAFDAPLGLYEEEKINKNRILVSINAVIPFPDSGSITELSQTFNYETAYRIALETLSQPISLLEDAGLQMLALLKTECPGSLGFQLRLEKMAPPLRGDVEKSFIEINWWHD